MKFFDAHRHPGDSKECSEVLQMISSAKREDFSRVLEHTHSLPGWGIHPWYCDTFDLDILNEIRENLKKISYGYVGEIGLDKVCSQPLSLQAEVFKKQLELAVEFQRPAVIHCVRAWGALWDILSRFPLKGIPLLLHGFSGSREMLRQFEGLNCYYSFSCREFGREKLKSVIKCVPESRFLLETDYPEGNTGDYLSLIQNTYREASLIRGLDLRTLTEIIDQNRRVFTG